ncbi:FecR family protein [Pendulispora rubella]|uniref:FecR family protein n=1 Tax=Pendulispora rubella TaxID=2741070 RepID=A0ABZ2LGF6_9BACT
MSRGPEYADLAARALRRELTEDDAFEPGQHGAARAQRIDAVRGAIRQRARRKMVARGAGAGVAVLAAAAAVALFARGRPAHVEAVAEASGEAAYVERDGAREALASGKKVQAGDHVVVPQGGHAALTLTTGTHLALEAEADLSVLSQNRHQIYWLAKGALQARVSKLGEGDRFVVRTPDADVEVRGTQFRVAAAEPHATCGNGSTTRVSVLEGVVVVRHGGVETPVAAGEEWPCASAASPPQQPPLVLPPSRGEGSGRGRDPGSDPGSDPGRAQGNARASAKRPPPAPAPVAAPETSTSDLSAQNDLFARATDQKRAGNARGALATFETFLARYPKSALAESAAVERWRLLTHIDRASARTAAKDYLDRYPNGFARADARALLGE